MVQKKTVTLVHLLPRRLGTRNLFPDDHYEPA